MKGKRQGIVFPADTERPVPETLPTIMWGGCDVTLDRFPMRWELEHRAAISEQSRRWFKPFMNALREVAHHVCVFDPFFDEDAALIIVEGLQRSPRISDVRVRILGDSVDVGDSSQRAGIVLDWFEGDKPSVEWLPMPIRRSFPFAHDRFCIIDTQLFHFGGTVGGAAQTLTAASWGWKESQYQALRFFDEAWAAVSR